MDSLNTYCIRPILSYLSLADLLSFRSVSCRFKKEVDEYLPKIRSLPLYLTTPRTPEMIAEYNELFPAKRTKREPETYYATKLSGDPFIRKLSFGTSGEETFEDGTILQNQSHFRLDDFVVLKDFTKLWKFVQFMKARCPKIEKLALVIDDLRHYLPEMVQIFRALPDIKVLLLENTLQDSCTFRPRSSNQQMTLKKVRQYEKNIIELPPEVYKAIFQLEHLEELYLFPRRLSQLAMYDQTGNEQNFVRRMLGKLRVFHFNTKFCLFVLPVENMLNGPLEEMACGGSDYDAQILDNEPQIYSKIKRFFFLGGQWSKTNTTDLELLPKESLKVLDISTDYHAIDRATTKNLNSFTGLESFHCRDLTIRSDFSKDHDDNDLTFIQSQLLALIGREPYEETVSKARATAARKKNRGKKNDVKNSEDLHDIEMVPRDLQNGTIKHLQVMKGEETAEDRKRTVRRWSRYFTALETCVFLEPVYHEIRVSDLQE